MQSPSISRQFAKWAFQLRYEDLSPEVIDKIKAFIMHGLTGGMLGIHSHHAKNIAALTLKEESHLHGAHIFHHHQKATRIGAAFANSELIHASNLFDSYRMLNHPGPVMIPVTLANAEFEVLSRILTKETIKTARFRSQTMLIKIQRTSP